MKLTNKCGVMGEIKILSLKELVPKLKEIYLPGGRYGDCEEFLIQTHIVYEEIVAEFDGVINDPGDGSISESFVRLIKVDGDLSKALKRSVLEQFVSVKIPNDNLYGLADTLQIHTAENYANSDFLVQVEKRAWIVVDLDQFKIIKKNGKAALICLRRNLMVVFNIEKGGGLYG